MELITGTVDAWVDALWPGRDWRLSDCERIREAFRRLSRTQKTWPVPADFLAALPERKLPPALPPKILSEEERAENLRRLNAMVEKIFDCETNG